ncbi:hypothetical protein B0H14DRAFT_2339085 [Mycena olivaceomarginata]|nr:hypothetical protein B0H14DRAFT_2339085 [Mycena olivaceomarginata]
MPVPSINRYSVYGNDKVEVLPPTFFNPSRIFAPVEVENLLDNITMKWNLNAEQDRAFRIFANHVSAPQTVPLKMYLGGMGGHQSVGRFYRKSSK